MTSFKKITVLSATLLLLINLPISSYAERPGWYTGLQSGYANTHMKVDDLVEVYKNQAPFPPQAYLQHFVASATWEHRLSI